MKKPLPVKSFRIYPERSSGLYFKVSIFRTLEDLRRYGREAFHSPAGRALGWCGGYSIRVLSGKGWTRPIVGEILLAARHLRTGIISHECTHAAFRYADRRGFSVQFASIRGYQYHDHPTGRTVSGSEERFCLVQGELTRQIVNGLFKYRFLRESARSDGR